MEPLKDYLILNTEYENTRYFTCDTLPMAKAKSKMLNYDNGKTIVCSLINGLYQPTLGCTEPRLCIIDAYATCLQYLQLYKWAISHLPVSFRYTDKLRKID